MSADRSCAKYEENCVDASIEADPSSQAVLWRLLSPLKLPRRINKRFYENTNLRVSNRKYREKPAVKAKNNKPQQKC